MTWWQRAQLCSDINNKMSDLFSNGLSSEDDGKRYLWHSMNQYRDKYPPLVWCRPEIILAAVVRRTTRWSLKQCDTTAIDLEKCKSQIIL